MRRLKAYAGRPVEQLAMAQELVATSRDLEVIRPALAVLGQANDPALRPFLHEKYAWCEAQSTRRDSSGFIRAGIVKALTPIIQADDLPLLLRALVTYQMQGLYELCAELRAAALIALNDLDPDLAAYHAARLLSDPLTSFSGQPALTAVKLLGAQQQFPPLFAVAVWRTGRTDVIAECLRQLVTMPAELVPLLVERYRDEEDEEILLGYFDLLLGRADSAAWADEIESFLRTTTLPDLYGLVVTQIVASRNEPLIARLKALADEESDPAKRPLLDHALSLL